MKTLATKPALRDNVMVGMPAIGAERWQARQEALGWPGILAALNRSSLLPHAWAMKSPRRPCETVMPRFHERLILAPVGAVTPETREWTEREEGACHADC